jgi:ABC-type antimicrobial peptide transport system permease subunit
VAATGVLSGAGAALGVARWLGSLLYRVSVTDPLSYGIGLLLLPAAALLGCWRPARRAAAVNPADIIRQE